MADSTRAMRKSIVDRDILPAFQNRLLNEITADDLRALCGKVKARGASATAVHIRDIVKQVYAFATLHGEKVDNPAADVGAASIASRWQSRLGADSLSVQRCGVSLRRHPGEGGVGRLYSSTASKSDGQHTCQAEQGLSDTPATWRISCLEMSRNDQPAIAL